MNEDKIKKLSIAGAAISILGLIGFAGYKVGSKNAWSECLTELCYLAKKYPDFKNQFVSVLQEEVKLVNK